MLISLVRRDPTACAAMRAVVDLAAADRGAASTALPLEAPGPLAPPSLLPFVVCSIDEAKFVALSRTIAMRFAGVPHEVVRIPDATSLGEGYHRGFARSRGDAVVFCHDDIDVVAPDAALRLARHVSYRAHRAGFRLAVACDLGIVHESKGDFGAEGSRYAARFRTRFPELAAAQGSPHFHAARVPSAADVLATQRRLAEIAAG